jgi:hypothetical protein
MGYDHRYITPLRASANGISERTVKEVKILLAKQTHGTASNWSDRLNAVQLAINNRISSKLNSTLFSLFFARKMPEPYGFASKEDLKKPTEERKLNVS